jgi:hypothetical protein
MKPETRAASRREKTGFELVSPASLLEREDTSREEKIELLHQWELDLREGMVAEEENMPAPEPLRVTLDEVLDALRALGAESQFHEVPTKHG